MYALHFIPSKTNTNLKLKLVRLQFSPCILLRFEDIVYIYSFAVNIMNILKNIH